MSNGLHIDECLDSAERHILKCLVISFLMRRQEECCPACLSELLFELAAESSELWTELNANEYTCTHTH